MVKQSVSIVRLLFPHGYKMMAACVITYNNLLQK
jgi:hypothetical protein